jgi:hypothetical protein
MARLSIYVETSILSFLCADPSPIQETLEKQRDTIRWWNTHRHDSDAFLSDEVIVEAARGNPEYARRRLDKAAELRFVRAEPKDRQFGERIIAQGLIPPNANVDATHLAVAVRREADILLTWNLRHLANPRVLPLVYNFLKANGLHVPAITTPKDLMESM